MKTINLILKGILLWATGIVTLTIIMSIDSLYDYTTLGTFIALIVFNIVAILATINCLTEDEFKILSGYNAYMKTFNKIEK